MEDYEAYPIGDAGASITFVDYAVQALLALTVSEKFPYPVIARYDALFLNPAERHDLRRQVLQAVKTTVSLRPIPSEESILDAIGYGASEDCQSHRWVINPIDDSADCIKGNVYSINLALVLGGEVLLSVIGLPRLVDETGVGALLVSVRGEGAVRLNMELDQTSLVTLDRKEIVARLQNYIRQSTNVSSLGFAAAAALLADTSIFANESLRVKHAGLVLGEIPVYLVLPWRYGQEDFIWKHAGMCVFRYLLESIF